MLQQTITSTESFLDRARVILLSFAYYDPTVEGGNPVRTADVAGPNHRVMDSQMLTTLMLERWMTDEDRIGLARCIVRADPNASRLIDYLFTHAAKPSDPTDGELFDLLKQLRAKSPEFGSSFPYQGKTLIELCSWIVQPWATTKIGQLQEMEVVLGLTGTNLASQRHKLLLEQRTHRVAAA